MVTPVRKTRACISLDAIEENIRTLWRRVGEDKKMMVLLKADAYGHGSVAVGKLAERIGVWAGGVATLEETEYLQRNGVQLPLFLLEDLFYDEVEAALERNVRFTVSSFSYVEQIDRIAGKLIAEGRIREKPKVHVNVDTGMGRLGIRVEKAPEMVAAIVALENVRLEGIYTHFPIADEADKSYSYAQLERFGHLLDELSHRKIRPPIIHSANSGATLDFPRTSAYTLIRPGVSTYGMYPSRDVDHSIPLLEAMTLKSALLKISRFPVGATIGYGCTFVTERPSIIGVVPIGYGDGFIRKYSNNAEVLVHGQRVPVVGRVSMDMITVDLTDLPEEVEKGAEVVIMGEQEWNGRRGVINSEELATRAETITYEVTCLIGKRVPRLFSYKGEDMGIKSINHTIDEL